MIFKSRADQFFNKFDVHPSEESTPIFREIDIHIVNRNFENNKINFQIFDLTGEERWQFIAESFIKNCCGFFLLYDQNIPTSLRLSNGGRKS